ncbi:Hint domain-containing protein [Marimonas lutisalis]|uniref:Hint domain-containing protein n=1 Tax=Marimonas lutisalis TaxID=2545756 RepID=UPI0010F67A8C|nr:Hint domain-containing protein [Marimonas lutisalis]
MPIAYVSEASYAGSPPTDFVEVAATSGTDTSGWTLTYYNQLGDWLYSQPFPAPSTTIAGKDVYVLNDTLSANISVGIIDDTGTLIQFVSFYDPPATATDGVLAGETPTHVGTTAASGESVQSDDGGASYYTQTTPNKGTIPCFAPGMMVDCPGGTRAVETLYSGDLVYTFDSGVQPVLWTDTRPQVFFRTDFSDRPILIPAGTFGAVSDLIVSPQHCLLVDNALVPAKSLLDWPGIRQMRGRRQITWNHFAFAGHEIVCVNGVWTESLPLGPMVLNGLPHGEKHRLQALYADHTPGQPLNGPRARQRVANRDDVKRVWDLADSTPNRIH